MLQDCQTVDQLNKPLKPEHGAVEGYLAACWAQSSMANAHSGQGRERQVSSQVLGLVYPHLSLLWVLGRVPSVQERDT